MHCSSTQPIGHFRNKEQNEAKQQSGQHIEGIIQVKSTINIFMQLLLQNNKQKSCA